MVNWILRRAAQALLAVSFVKGGFDAARKPGPRADMAGEFGFSHPATVVRLNGAAMMVGGTALALDKAPRLAATGLIASLVPTTAAGHAFWKLDGADRKAQQIQFGKNLGLLGGLVLVIANRRG